MFTGGMFYNRRHENPEVRASYPMEDHLPSTDGAPELAYAIQTATDAPLVPDPGPDMSDYRQQMAEWSGVGKDMANQRLAEDAAQAIAAAARTREQKATKKRLKEEAARKKKEEKAAKDLYEQLSSNRGKIVEEHQGVQGEPMDVGGYYRFDFEKCEATMRPSSTMNSILEE